ncbi:MAG: septum formation initiator family protein [Clostridium sp.]|nr:septum formation initiator family protein [Clostridium sp.]
MRAVSERRQKKKKKENLNNRLALVGITMVVLSLAVTVQVKGNELRATEKQLIIQEENLEAQVKAEEERAARLEEQRVYVQTKEYIEKVAKEKLGLVNRGEVILKPSEKR